MKIHIFALIILISVGCATQNSINSIPIQSDRGEWTQKPLKQANGVILVPQWHLPSNLNTRFSKAQLPQDRSQNAIYQELSSWIDLNYSKIFIIEGCEGVLNSDLSFNGWTLQQLKQAESIDPIQTHVGLKLLAKFNSKIRVECGDNQDLIKEHQLSLSNIRGLAGYKIRLAQANLSKLNRDSYLASAKQALNLPAASNEKKVLKKIDTDLALEINNFENLLKQRNQAFLAKIKNLQGRKVIIIGALHIEDLKSSLDAGKIPYAVWRPLDLPPGETELIKQLKLALGLKI